MGTDAPATSDPPAPRLGWVNATVRRDLRAHWRDYEKLEKTRIVAEYFRSRDLEDAAVSAIFLSGGAFPAFEERTLQVGGSLLWKVVKEVTGASDNELGAGYRKTGDLGAAVYTVMIDREPRIAQKQGDPGAPSTRAFLSLREVRSAFDQIAATRTANGKGELLRILLERATALEAKYILKIITGELRIGLKESLVEEAIAKAYDEPLAQVQRANMLLGDIGETLRLAAEHRARRGAHAAVSSHRLHAGQSGRRCRGGVPIFRARAGRGQVRRHSRAGALRWRAGASVLAHARRGDAVVSRAGRRRSASCRAK